MIDEWQDIETAPRDGTVVLGFDPDGYELDENVFTWPKGTILHVTPMRWHEPNERTHEEAGWYAPSCWVSSGVYDDRYIDFDAIQLTPTHWMPLPLPPAEEPQR